MTAARRFAFLALLLAAVGWATAGVGSKATRAAALLALPGTAAASAAPISAAPTSAAPTSAALAAAAPTSAPTTATLPVDETLLQRGTTLSGRAAAVLDGDSLLLRTSRGALHSIRIAAVDAPERGQPGAEQSRQALRERIGTRALQVQVLDRDRYGRVVGRVLVGRNDAGLAQIAAGQAWYYAQYEKTLPPSLRRRYALAQQQARQRGAGLWSGREPLAPWQFRQQQRQRIASPTPQAMRGNGIERRGLGVDHHQRYAGLMRRQRQPGGRIDQRRSADHQHQVALPRQPLGLVQHALRQGLAEPDHVGA